LDSEKSLSESQESTEKVAIQSESSIDLATILQEINKKIDEITGSITELKEDVQTLKLNVNDALGKTEQTHKEVAEIRNLVYSIKYDR
jgi:predicted transcriptional regulator